MLALDFVFVLALLTEPIDAHLPEMSADAHANLQETFQSMALLLELLDPRETRYILTRPEEFASDIGLLRRRHHDLAGAPCINDAMRFPTREVVNELLAFNREYKHHIDMRQTVEMSHWWDHQNTLAEVDQLYRIWDTVRDARCDYYYVTVRRQALKRLREQLGDEAYFSGQMPPYVPLWRFQAMN